MVNLKINVSLTIPHSNTKLPTETLVLYVVIEEQIQSSLLT